MNKKLYRIKESAYISGVCSGLAEYFDVDVTIVRLIWVIGTIFLTAGIGGFVLYLACALIIPVVPSYIDGDYKEKQ